MIRRIVQTVLVVLAVELIHFLLFSGALWALGRWLEKGSEQLSATSWIWLGLLHFWYDGPGWYIVGACVVLLLSHLLEVRSDRLALKTKQEAVGRDVEQRAKALAETMRQEIDAVVKQENKEQASALKLWEKGMYEYKEKLIRETKELEEREKKTRAAETELYTLRRKQEALNEQRKVMRSRIAMAEKALTDEPMRKSEALRHLKNAKSNHSDRPKKA